jgi:hypothetical protein
LPKDSINTTEAHGEDDVIMPKNVEEAVVDDSAAKGPDAAAKRAALEAALQAVVKRAKEGDRSALPSLRAALDQFPTYFEHAGDLAMMAHQTWLDFACGSDLFTKETTQRKLAAMRAELAGPHPSPLESLVVERIVACWLQVHHADMLFVGNQSSSEGVRKELLKRQESAQGRHLDAIKQLAKVRKLLLPSGKAKNAKVVAQAVRNRDPKLGVFSGAGVDEACEDPLGRLGLELKANAASAVLEFPRISKEYEADALLNGSGAMN